MDYKKINIKCIIYNVLYNCIFQVFIYNKNNVCVFNKCCCGNIFFKPSSFGTYKIVIIPKIKTYPNYISSSFIVDEKSDNLIIYNFKKIHIAPLITIKITDQVYKGLKIMKGEIKLWPNHIQLR